MSKLSDWIDANRADPDCERAVRNYTLNTEMYEREFADAEARGVIVECQHCGYPENPERSLNGDEYIEHKVCFSCWFWLIHMGLKNSPTGESIVVNGTHYVDGGASEDNNRFLGFGGSKWAYRKIGETDWVETNNMWHQGKIPKRLNIADTHEFRPFVQPTFNNDL